MATTPTYSWPIPDDTDLVKDGAEAIRDLGNAIDTTVDGLGVGLVHIETQSFSAVSAVTLNTGTNYKNFKIVVSHTGATNDSNALLRLSLSGTPNTSNFYRNAVWTLTTGNVSAGLVNSGTSSFIYSTNETASTSNFAGFVFDLIDLNVATFTKIISNGSNVNSGGAVTYFTGSCLHDVSTAFNEVQLSTSAGTFSGTAYVFGYKD
jgi:hypothetical protein